MSFVWCSRISFNRGGTEVSSGKWAPASCGRRRSHAGPGGEPLPAAAAFRLDQIQQADQARGFLFGSSGAKDQSSHLVVVILDYKSEAMATLVGADFLEVFAAATGQWTALGQSKTELRRSPGGGKLLRVR